MEMDPSVAAWLRQVFGEGFSNAQDLPELTRLILAARKNNGAVATPDDVLAGWHRHIALSKNLLLEAELRFVDSARSSGWAESRIVEVLGIDGEDLDEYHRGLTATQATLHPSNRPVPFTG